MYELDLINAEAKVTCEEIYESARRESMELYPEEKGKAIEGTMMQFQMV